MAVQRWVFDDGNGDTWTMSKNPTEMTSVHRERKVTVIGTTAVDGRDLMWEGRAAPIPWQFSGKIYSHEEYETMRVWVYDKVQRLWITDHFGRKLTVVLTKLDAKPRTKHKRYWYHEYSVDGMVLNVGPATVGV